MPGIATRGGRRSPAAFPRCPEEANARVCPLPLIPAGPRRGYAALNADAVALYAGPDGKSVSVYASVPPIQHNVDAVVVILPLPIRYCAVHANRSAHHECEGGQDEADS